MKVLKLALCAAAASFAMAGAASAQEGPSISYNIGVATNYVFRGIEATAGEAEVFGGADLTAGMIYAGTWLSNVGPSGDMGVEYDLYAGVKPAVGPVALDLGVVYYGYTDGDTTDYSLGSTWEAKVAASIPAGPVTLGGAIYWTPDFAQTGESGTYYEVNAAISLASKATLSGALGTQTADVTVAPGASDSYVTFNVGVTYPVTDAVTLDARFISVDDDATSALFLGSGDKVVGTLKAAF